MKPTLEIGLTLTRRIDIDEPRTIDFMGDELRIYSTPWMVHDVEHTCRDLLLQHQEAGEDSVGAHVEVDHLGATMLGMWVEVTATVTGIDGARVSFEAVVRDAVEEVGRGRHVRFAIDTARQRKRLQAKAEKLKAAADR